MVVFSLGFGLLLAGCSSKDGATPSASPTPTASLTASAMPTASPMDTASWPTEIQAKTKAFYDEYMLCMTKPPVEAKDHVGDYCQSHNSNATKDLPANLKRGGVSDAGADPVVCAQSFPMSYSVNLGFLDSKGRGQAIVSEKFGAGSRVLVSATLLNDSGTFLVDNLTCAVE
jgi:hypothetical protein